MTQDRQRRKWRLSSLIGAVAIFAAACAPLPTVLPTVTPTSADINVDAEIITVASDDRTEISVAEVDGKLVLGVHSESGIGSAEVSGIGDEAGPVLLRLYVSGLEQFRFVYGSTEIEASVSSSGDLGVMQSKADQDGTRQTIDADSPYWLTIEPISSNVEQSQTIPLEDGYFQVALPADFVGSGQESFSFSWIDFYR